MKADSGATYMAAGIDLSLKHLQELGQQHPDRSGMLIMLTDGKNQPPSKVPAEKQITFAQLREKYAGQADFQPGKDWFFWYCFIGQADAEVQAFAQSMQGESKPVTGPWKFLKVRFNRALLKLPDVQPGNWMLEYPTPADRQLGDALTVTTRNPGEYDLQISNIALDDAKADERVFVAPRSIRMNKPEQQVVLQLTAQNITPGEHRGRIIFRAPGKMVFVQPPQLNVVFRAVQAVVTVAPKEGLPFGRMLPGKDLERTFELLPNEAAVRSSAGKPVRIDLPKDLPPGVSLVAEPASVPLDKPTTVKLKLTVAADAQLPAEGFRGAISFTSAPGIAFTPASLPVSFEGSQPSITVVPAGDVDFGTLTADEPTVRELVLVPNEAAASVGCQVKIKPEGKLPAGANLQIEPAEALVEANTTVRLTLRSETGAASELHGSLVLSADRGAKVEPAQIAWRAKKTQASVEVYPSESLDFGTLLPGGQAVRELLLKPNRAAAASNATVSLAVEGLTNGITADIAPPQADLKDSVKVKVTLKAAANATEGQPAAARIKVAIAPEMVAASSAALALNYRVQSTAIHIDAKSLPFENVPPGDSQTTQSVRIVGGEGARGKTVTLAWQWTDKLPSPMKILPAPQQVTLAKSSEDVPVTLTITDAPAGTYRGSIGFSAQDAVVEPQEVPVTVVIGEAAIIVRAGTWRLPGWQYNQEYRWPITIQANKFAEGATITSEILGELPEGICLTLVPSPWKLAKGENRAELVLQWNGKQRPPRGTHRGMVTFRTDRPKLIVENASLPIELAVPWLTTVEWIIALACGGLLIVAAIAGWLYAPRGLVGTLRVESLGGAAVRDGRPNEQVGEDGSEDDVLAGDDGARAYEVDDLISLEAASGRRFWIGGEPDCDLVMPPGSGRYAVIGRRRATYVGRPRGGSQPVKVIPSEDAEFNLEPGQNYSLQYGDKIRIQSATFVYED